MAKKRVLILGGGFGGVYVAKELEKLRADRDEFDIALINRDNYFVYQPMLAEIISGHVGIFDTVSPLRSLLRKTDVIVRDVESVDLANKRVITSPGFKPVRFEYPYDYLVLALGNVTDFRGLTGLTQHALRFKYLSDALMLRNHVIHVLEEAAVETNARLKEALLTFVVAGGGWSGVECVAEMNDFVRNVARKYRNVDPKQVRMVLLQSDTRILREMDEGLALAAQQVMQKNGIEIRLETRLAAATGDEAVLNTGERIPTKTLVSTVPGSPNPVIEALDLPKGVGRGGKSNHRIKVNLELQVEGSDHIWAIGDCAQIPEPGDTSGTQFCPPTAQHAVREGALAAQNIVATIRGGARKQFAFTGLGQMGVFGHHSAVAQLALGDKKINIKGYLAWLMWRAVYLMKLPGWDRQVRTFTAWLTASYLPTDTVQLTMRPQAGIVEEHYETGQYVFNQGDLGDRLFIIIKGKAEVIKTENRVAKRLAELSKGQYFGEMALLKEGQSTRGAAVRAMEPLDVLSVPRHDIVALVEYLPALRESFDQVMRIRDEQNRGTLQPPAVPAPDGAVNPMAEDTIYLRR
ncbi:MAG TPA: FAD-dependent oxidoreductase [Chthonomonadaceae bacterium]|nr:FAD-dependent oxidoreductase [Chthonomonadaceae bacterium]